MRKNFPITELCEALGVSRSGYHNLGKREPSRRRRANEQLLHQIRIIHSDRHTRCYGSPRMTRELRALGIGLLGESCRKNHAFKGLASSSQAPFPPEDYPARSRGASFAQSAIGSRVSFELPVLSSLATSLTFLPGKAGSIWLWSSICSHAPFSAGNCLTLCTPIWSSVPPHAPSSQASCPREQSFTPIAAANTRPPSPASCSPDMVCAKA